MVHPASTQHADSSGATAPAREVWTTRRGLLLLALVLLAYFSPVVFLGHVIYPHDNAQESGRALEADYEASSYASTHRLDDQSTAYIPELAHALDADHSSWIATWNPHNELGRPLLQHFATGRAWIVGNAVSFFTRDPFRFYTWMALLAVCGTAFAAFGFFRERALHPLACLVGALGISVGPFATVWQSFPMLPWGFCWVFCILLGIERWLKRPSCLSAGAIAFAVYSLLMSGYPQHIVMMGWSISGYVVLRVWSERNSLGGRARALGVFASLAVIGLIAALPMLLDLFVELEHSVRAEVPTAFAMKDVSRVQSFRDLAFSLVRIYDNFLAGNPFSPDYKPWASLFRGYLLSPFYVGLICLAPLIWRRKQAGWWLACFVIALIANHSAGFYSIGVRWMGLQFSNLPPIAGALIPAAVLAALVTDALLRDSLPKWSAFVAAIPVVGGLMLVQYLQVEVHRLYAGLSVATACGVILFARRPRALTLLPFVLIVVFHHGRALLMTRPRWDVSTDSVLLQGLRDIDGRYAWVGPRRGFLLRPNQEMVFGLSSIHSYYSLQTREFAGWAARASGRDDQDYQRMFLRLVGADQLEDGLLAGSHVTHFLSWNPLHGAFGAQRSQISGVTVTVADRPGRAALMLELEECEAVADARRDSYRVTPERLLEDRGAVAVEDLQPEHAALSFAAADQERVLFLSRADHPHWVARANGAPVDTVQLNGRFLGVRVPAGATELELRFEPNVHWAWMPQLAFALFGAAAVFSALRRRASSPG